MVSLFFKKTNENKKAVLRRLINYFDQPLPGFDVGGSRSPFWIVALCPPDTLPPRGPTSILYSFKNGKIKKPSFELMVKIADTLDVSLDEFR